MGGENQSDSITRFLDIMEQQLLDSAAQHERLRGMARWAVSQSDSPGSTALLGIRTRGALLAHRLRRIMEEEHGLKLDLGVLDIALYRDDLSQLAEVPQVRKTDLDFDIADRTILLIDDVLYTGRTIRSAFDAIVDFGRPSCIRLAVLVDRGGRELPIQADYAALTLAVDEDHIVKVCCEESDGRDETLLMERASIQK
jgi:pyrimidine operon attenuation protein/uracil phosphoribosyltransferase